MELDIASESTLHWDDATLVLVNSTFLLQYHVWVYIRHSSSWNRGVAQNAKDGVTHESDVSASLYWYWC